MLGWPSRAIKIATGVILVAFLCGLLYGAYQLGRETKQGEWDAADLAKADARQEALEIVANKIASIDVKSTTIIKPIQKEIRTNTVYADCKHSPEQLRNLNELIGVGSGILPRTLSIGR